MFGISPLGWLHTLGSLPAIPLAIYMLARYGRVVPGSTPGNIYLITMLIGCISIFFVAKQSASYGVAVVTMVLLLIGYTVRHVSFLGRSREYIETVCLSLTVFLLMVPSVSETLRRVPEGNPIVSEPESPLLLGALGVLFVTLVIGVSLQILRIRKANLKSYSDGYVA